MKKRNIRIELLIILALVVSLALSACGSKADTADGAADAAAESAAAESADSDDAAAESADSGEYEFSQDDLDNLLGENYLDGVTLSFTTTDLDGNEVTDEDIFSKNKYTMINFWASWCPPCVAELPELQRLSKNFEEKGCGIIGVLLDGDGEGLEDGKNIMAEAGVEYLNIMPFEAAKLIGSEGVPVTLFVDSEGTVVGHRVLGAFVPIYEVILDNLLSEEN